MEITMNDEFTLRTIILGTIANTIIVTTTIKSFSNERYRIIAITNYVIVSVNQCKCKMRRIKDFAWPEGASINSNSILYRREELKERSSHLEALLRTLREVLDVVP